MSHLYEDPLHVFVVVGPDRDAGILWTTLRSDAGERGAYLSAAVIDGARVTPVVPAQEARLTPQQLIRATAPTAVASGFAERVVDLVFEARVAIPAIRSTRIVLCADPGTGAAIRALLGSATDIELVVEDAPVVPSVGAAAVAPVTPRRTRPTRPRPPTPVTRTRPRVVPWLVAGAAVVVAAGALVRPVFSDDEPAATGSAVRAPTETPSSAGRTQVRRTNAPRSTPTARRPVTPVVTPRSTPTVSHTQTPRRRTGPVTVQRIGPLRYRVSWHEVRVPMQLGYQIGTVQVTPEVSGWSYDSPGLGLTYVLDLNHFYSSGDPQPGQRWFVCVDAWAEYVGWPTNACSAEFVLR